MNEDKVVTTNLVPDLQLKNVKLSIAGNVVSVSAEVSDETAVKLNSLIPFINLLLQLVK